MQTGYNFSQRRHLGLSGVGLLLSLIGWAAPAGAAPLDASIAWLTATQGSDGAWSEMLPLQATTEVVGTLREVVPSHASIPPGTAYLQTAAASNTDALARIVVVTAAAPTDLLTLQNSDGGWGLAAGLGSEPWTTALALRALAATGNGVSNSATQAVNWLLGTRLDDGGWAYTAGETSRVALTAEVVRTLGSVPRNLDIQATLDRAVTLFQAKRGTGGGYGDAGSTPLETGLVVRALAAAGVDLAPITPATLAYLTTSQQTDGSWEGDPYVTAIALHAVWLLQNPPVRPTTGGVTAQVLDAATGQTLASVSARRVGEPTLVLTDAFGRFALDGLPAGPVTLEFSRGGYLTQTGMATVTVGVVTPLGTIRLIPAPATAAITGRVTDATAGTALAGVAVTATGGAGTLTGTTGVDGSYSIGGVTPGSLTLTASKIGYKDASATGTAVAGVTIQFSPALPPVGQTPPPTATVRATILNTITRTPLAGAILSLGSGGSGTTDAAGLVTLTEVPAGTYSGTVSAGGYLSHGFTAVLSSGSALDLGTVLLTSLTAPGSLTGLVVDAATNQPLAGARLALASNSTVAATTVTSGVVTLTNLPSGRVDFTLTKDGYSSLAGFAAVAPGTVTDLAVLRLTPLRTTATIRGTVTDAATGLALTGVQVQVTGAVSLTATTNAAGSYEMIDVAPGEVTITASKAGYAPTSATTALAAGAVLTFSPTLGTGAGTGEGSPILGSVIDGDTGEPFPGATVALVGGEPSTTTSATGAFTLPLSVNRPSVFYIEASAPGYLGEVRYVAVFEDTPTYLAPFILARPGAGKLAGRVVAAETETPLVGVTLSVLGAEDSIVTDENGAFLLTGLNAGALSLALSKAGYGTARVDTAVSRIGTTDVGALFLAALGAPPGADLALFPEDLVVNPAVPQPGGLVSVTAVVRNLGTTDAGGTLQLYAGNPNLGGTLLTSAPVTVGATFRQTISLPSVTYPADRPQLFVVVSGVEPSDVDPRNNVVTPGRPPAAIATSALDAVRWLVSHQIPMGTTQGAWADYSVVYLNSMALPAYRAMSQTGASQYQPAMARMRAGQAADGSFGGLAATCFVLLTLQDAGEPPSSTQIQDGLANLRRQQNADGSWASNGRGFPGYAYATGLVLTTLIRSGVPKTDPAVTRGVTWLKTTQNTDGYWGSEAGTISNPYTPTDAVVGLALATSATDPAVVRAKQYYDGWRSTNSQFLLYWLQMMWTLNPADGAIPAMVSNLLSRQRPDGGWSNELNDYTDFFLTTATVTYVRRLGFTDNRLTTGLAWISNHMTAEGESFPDDKSNWASTWATIGLQNTPLTVDGKSAAVARARATLVATQYSDGSWAWVLPPSYAPFIIPTATSVHTLTIPPPANRTPTEETTIARGVTFLRDAQNKVSDPSLRGGWPNYRWDSYVTQAASVAALLGMLQAGYGTADPEVSRGLTWLVSRQLPDGSWGNTEETALAALILERAGVHPDRVQQAIAWLRANQNPNGGWGSLLGQSSSSRYAAIAVLALSRAGERGLPVARGVCYIQSVQRPNGSWSDWAMGTGQILWGLAGAQVNQQVTVSLALNKAVYYPGDTIQMTVTAQGIALDQLTLQGTLSPQEGVVTPITFTREADRFVATYAIPGTAIPGTWAVSIIGTGPSGESGVACATLPVKNPVGNASDLAVLPADITFAGGTGGAVTISAAVRNLQPVDATDVVVRFYDGDPNSGGTALGQTTLPRIEGGGIGLAALTWMPPGQRDIYVKADPGNTVAETEEGNNLAFRTFVPVGGTPPAPLTLALDRTEYPAATDVQVALSVGNPRPEVGDFSVRLAIELAATGEAIAALPEQSVTGLASGEARSLSLAWNTGTTPAGQYILRGTLRDASGTIITSRLVLFRIVASGGSPTTPQIASQVTTDRQAYEANQTATISVTATNTTMNAAWYNLLVSVAVQDSAGTSIWTANQTVASLPAQTSRALSFSYAVGTATPGTYTVVERVTDPTSGALLDMKTTTFQIASSAATGAGLVGTLTATPSAVYRNAAVTLSSTIRNSGNASTDLVGLQALIVNPQTQAVAQTLPMAGGVLTLGAERADTVTVPGGSLAATAANTSYLAILQAVLTGDVTRTLASTPITVIDRAPIFEEVAPQTVQEGQTLSVIVRAADPDGDPVTLSVGALPANATFELASATVTFAPDFLQAGAYAITITATDGILSTTRTVDITVLNTNRTPMVSPLVNLVVNEGEIVHLAILATDPDGTGSLTLHVANLPPWATFTDLGAGQGTISLAPAFGDAGSYPVIAVTVADHDATNPLTDMKTFDLTVQNVNRAPALEPIANQSLAEGATLEVAVVATDPDGSGSLRLTLENAPGFVALTDQGSGQGILRLTPGYAESGAYPGVTVRVADQDPVAPLDAVQVFTVTVGNTNRAPQVTPIPNQTVGAGAVLDVPVTATDPDGATSLTLSVAGAPIFVTLTDHGGGQGTLHLAPGSGTAATYLNVTLIATDHDPVTPLEGQAAFTLTVTPATSPSFGAYLHGSGSAANPPILFLDDNAPTATTAKYRDSAGVDFNNGNPWVSIGTWTAQPQLTPGTLSALSDLQTWVGLKNSDDIGTQFDLRAEVFKNGTLVASGVARCLTGITRNPALAKEVAVTFDPFPPAEFDGVTDTLSLTLLTRIGTNPDGTKCPGPGGSHNNARGLRLYFDATTRASQFGVAVP